MATQQIKSWDWRKAVNEARNRLVENKFPIPKKPTVGLGELEYPTDIESVNSIQLGNLMLRLTSWYAYATASLAFARAELTAFKEVYEAMLGQRMYYLSRTMDGRSVKDVLRSLALEKDDALGAMFQEKLELEQKVMSTEGLVESLAIQVKGIEAEQIRRATARKIETGGSF